MLSRNTARIRGVAGRLMTSTEEAYLKEEYARQIEAACARNVAGTLNGTNEVAQRQLLLASLLSDLHIMCDTLSNLESRVHGFNARMIGHAPVSTANNPSNPEPQAESMMDKLRAVTSRMFQILEDLNASTSRLDDIA